MSEVVPGKEKRWVPAIETSAVHEFVEVLLEQGIGLGGSIARLSRLDLGNDQADWSAYSAKSHPFQPGEQVFPWRSGEPVTDVTGYGCHPDPDMAMLCALVECFERTCAARWRPSDLIETSSRELGLLALNLDSLPVCSDDEYASPYCTLRRPDQGSPMRWTKATEVSTGKSVRVPLVLSHTHAGRKHPAEAIAHAITTGCAAHSSAHAAALSGLLEVIERDALALTWLLRRNVPEIKIWNLDPESRSFWEHHERLQPEVSICLFDITTDVGVPVLLCLQTQPSRPYAYTLVTCSAAPTYREALRKVLRDAAICRFANARPRSFPPRVTSFSAVPSGAAYMASVQRSDSFSFLRETKRRVHWSQLDRVTEAWTLERVVARLKDMQMPTYLVDLTTPESAAYGIEVCRAIVPGLQPISFHYAARYLGHTRLRDFRRQIDPEGTVTEINHDPLPFA